MVRLAWVGLVLAGIAALLGARWPREDPLPDRVDAVVVLSAGMQNDSTLYWLGAARLREAVQLADSLRVPVVTTDAGKGSEAAQRRMAGHVPLIQATGAVQSTRDEAQAVAKILPHGRIVLVTSTYHTRRACAAFARVGFRVTCRGVWTAKWYTMPRDLAYDLAAYLQYRLKGWV